jgi:hypothetical protein
VTKLYLGQSWDNRSFYENRAKNSSRRLSSEHGLSAATSGNENPAPQTGQCRTPVVSDLPLFSSNPGKISVIRQTEHSVKRLRGEDAAM